MMLLRPFSGAVAKEAPPTEEQMQFSVHLDLTYLETEELVTEVFIRFNAADTQYPLRFSTADFEGPSVGGFKSKTKKEFIDLTTLMKTLETLPEDLTASNGFSVAQAKKVAEFIQKVLPEGFPMPQGAKFNGISIFAYAYCPDKQAKLGGWVQQMSYGLNPDKTTWGPQVDAKPAKAMDRGQPKDSPFFEAFLEYALIAEGKKFSTLGTSGRYKAAASSAVSQGMGALLSNTFNSLTDSSAAAAAGPAIAGGSSAALVDPSTATAAGGRGRGWLSATMGKLAEIWNWRAAPTLKVVEAPAAAAAAAPAEAAPANPVTKEEAAKALSLLALSAQCYERASRDLHGGEVIDTRLYLDVSREMEMAHETLKNAIDLGSITDEHTRHFPQITSVLSAVLDATSPQIKRWEEQLARVHKE